MNMCRISAYIGPPVRLSALIDDPPHGLTDQSRNAREMADSTVAGDGWGVGWHEAEAGPTPGLVKSILPLWSDQNGRSAPHAIVSGSFVGHVRYASPNIETDFANTPLYVMDDHLWTINGEVQPWPGPLSKALRDRLDPDHEADLQGTADGEMLGALWRTHFRRIGGRDIALAMRSMLREARDLVREHHGKIKANLILASAKEVLAVRYAEPGEANSLYELSSEPRWHGGSVVASEPMDDGPGWHKVGPDTLVRVDGQDVRLEPLDLDRADLPLRRHQTA
jgi:glutamine amidotransferase